MMLVSLAHRLTDDTRQHRRAAVQRHISLAAPDDVFGLVAEAAQLRPHSFGLVPVGDAAPVKPALCSASGVSDSCRRRALHHLSRSPRFDCALAQCVNSAYTHLSAERSRCEPYVLKIRFMYKHVYSPTSIFS
ncbi:hypothetical protein XFF6992_320003 [Xanthomonas citri pv. fuscans]|nr:hypothetical protein XFF6992_320003 [Xanthomonas citri pv. fuscans]SOO33305.1 hypothetical protein XFF6994_2810003 [Xanthomonas citri pv. fuscans]